MASRCQRDRLRSAVCPIEYTAVAIIKLSWCSSILYYRLIFTAVADALEWIIRQNGVTLVDHYLDDFITMGPPGSETCGQNLDRILAVCRELGVPLALDKLEGPSHCLTFLGIEMDTQRGVLRLPTDKLSRVKVLLAQWSTRKTCRRRQLESLVGTLQHACRVVKPGRAFLRRMIDPQVQPRLITTFGLTGSSARICNGGAPLRNTGTGWPCSPIQHSRHSQ